MTTQLAQTRVPRNTRLVFSVLTVVVHRSLLSDFLITKCDQLSLCRTDFPGALIAGINESSAQLWSIWRRDDNDEVVSK